jgi:predicted DNA-binding transcriptional regulator AlpA
MINSDHLSQERLLRLKGVLDIIPISKTAWHAGVKDGRFPKPVRLGPRTVAWKMSEIQALIYTGV